MQSTSASALLISCAVTSTTRRTTNSYVRCTSLSLTEEQYANHYLTLALALRQYPHLHIVTFDWIERSILRKKWQLPERFEIASIMEERQEEKEERKEKRDEEVDAIGEITTHTKP